MINNRFILDFLRELSNNNNRDWFSENKERYLHANALFKEEVGQLIDRCAMFDDSVALLTPQDAMFRIYRDVRFSPDKSPYKRHFGAYIAKGGGRKSDYAGYYLHLQPGQSMLSGGVYCPTPQNLKAVREHLEQNFEEFSDIIHTPEFERHFGSIIATSSLKRMPKGFAADAKAGNFLLMKDYIVEHRFTDAEVESEGFLDTCVQVCKAMLPSNSFFNEALEL